MKRRYTTRAEDAAFVLRRLADANIRWTVGDTCRTYRLDGVTTVTAIDGDTVRLADGTQMHRSRMRPVEEVKK